MKITFPPHIRWPMFVAGALALQVISSMVTIYFATSNPSYAVEDDYYQKALRWDETRAQQRRNLDLGWNLDFDVTPPTSTGDRAVLGVTILDSDSVPISDAAITVELFHNARAGEILKAVLDPAGDGVYEAQLPMRRTGLWEFRLVVVRGAQKFTHTEKRYVVLGGK